MATHPEIAVDDEEIAALLEELEAEQSKMTAAEPAPAPAPTSKPVPAPVAESEPEPTPETKPLPVKEPEPAVEHKVLPRGHEKPVQADLVVNVKVRADERVFAEPAGPVVPEPTANDMAKEQEAEDGTTAPGPKLNYFVDVNQFNRDTKLTEATLDNAMMEQAGLRAFYGSQAAQAEAQHARLKVRFDVLEAKLYDEHRKALATGGEKVTEKMVENAVKLDPRWAKAKNAVIEAETIASINKSLVISLADRRDMMIQLGADRREEFKGGVRILAEQNERDSLAARARDAFKSGRGVQ